MGRLRRMKYKYKIWRAKSAATSRTNAIDKGWKKIAKLRVQAAGSDPETQALKNYQAKIQMNTVPQWEAEEFSAKAKLEDLKIDKEKDKEFDKYQPSSNATEEEKKQVKEDKDRANEIYDRIKVLRHEARVLHKQYTRAYVAIQNNMEPKPGESGPHWGYRPFRIKMSAGDIYKNNNKINQLKRKAESAKVDQEIIQGLTKNTKLHPLAEAEKLEQAIAHFEEARAIREAIDKEIIKAETRNYNAKFGIISKRWLTPAEKKEREDIVNDLRSDHKMANAIMAAAPKTPEGMQALAKNMKEFNEIREIRDTFRKLATDAEKALEESTKTLDKSKKFKAGFKGIEDKHEKTKKRREAFERVERSYQTLKEIGLKEPSKIGIIAAMPRKELAHIQASRRLESAKTDYTIAKNIMSVIEGPPPDPSKLQSVKNDLQTLQEIQAMKDKMRSDLEAAEKALNKPKYTFREAISKLKTSREKSPARRENEQRRAECLQADFNITQKMLDDLKGQKPVASKDIERVRKVTEALNKLREERNNILDALAVQEKQLEKYEKKFPKDNAEQLKKNSEALARGVPDPASHIEKNYTSKNYKHLKMARDAEALKTDLAVIDGMIKDAGKNYKVDAKINSLEERLALYKEISKIRDNIKDNLDVAERNLVRNKNRGGIVRGVEIGFGNKTPAQKTNERRIVNDLQSDFAFAQKMLNQFKPPKEVTEAELKKVGEQMRNHEKIRKVRDDLREQLGIDEGKLEAYKDKSAKATIQGAWITRKVNKHTERVADGKKDYAVIQGMIQRAEADPKLLEGSPSPIQKEIKRYQEAMKIKDDIRKRLEENEIKKQKNGGAYYEEKVGNLKADLLFARKMMDALKPPIDEGKLDKFKETMEKYREIAKFRDQLLRKKLGRFTVRESMFSSASELERRKKDSKGDYDAVKELMQGVENDPTKLEQIRKNIELYKKCMKLRDKVADRLTSAEQSAAFHLSTVRGHVYNELRGALRSDHAAINETMRTALKTEGGLNQLKQVIKDFNKLTEIRDNLYKKWSESYSNDRLFYPRGINDRSFQAEYRESKREDLEIACGAMKKLVEMQAPITAEKVAEAKEQVKMLQTMIKKMNELRKEVIKTKQELSDTEKAIKKTKENIEKKKNQIEKENAKK